MVALISLTIPELGGESETDYDTEVFCCSNRM